jgi:hypothetical protein
MEVVNGEDVRWKLETGDRKPDKRLRVNGKRQQNANRK